MIRLEDVQRGYDAGATKRHNAEWVRKIDGTPIANDNRRLVGSKDHAGDSFLRRV
ncbi:hypothetical protein HGP14_07825 [Rhizobium sp. P32RR-XVIII]|uniref:hypothetical protein n=1 Tax=Rhizobium sp. P32RR-XVIII TaxID=2726738 RepID=UPI001456F754|nr:hypothetical protein [Rhizobium sp. P32RR-XVIII]NLS03278.1 hypothetical protein [Rhizobium sp. P32RR-XVIII]